MAQRRRARVHLPVGAGRALRAARVGAAARPQRSARQGAARAPWAARPRGYHRHVHARPIARRQHQRWRGERRRRLAAGRGGRRRNRRCYPRCPGVSMTRLTAATCGSFQLRCVSGGRFGPSAVTPLPETIELQAATQLERGQRGTGLMFRRRRLRTHPANLALRCLGVGRLVRDEPDTDQMPHVHLTLDPTWRRSAPVVPAFLPPQPSRVVHGPGRRSARHSAPPAPTATTWRGPSGRVDGDQVHADVRSRPPRSFVRTAPHRRSGAVVPGRISTGLDVCVPIYTPSGAETSTPLFRR